MYLFGFFFIGMFGSAPLALAWPVRCDTLSYALVVCVFQVELIFMNSTTNMKRVMWRFINVYIYCQGISDFVQCTCAYRASIEMYTGFMINILGANYYDTRILFFGGES